MDIRNVIYSGIRTGVAALVGFVFAWLISKGIELDPSYRAGVEGLIFAGVTFLYNAVVNWLALKVHPSFGYLLLIPKTPEYNAVAAKTPDGQTVATELSPLPTGEIVVVRPAEPYDPAKAISEPHPYEEA